MQKGKEWHIFFCSSFYILSEKTYAPVPFYIQVVRMHGVALIGARAESGFPLTGFLTLRAFEGRFNLINSRLCSAKAFLVSRLPF